MPVTLIPVFDGRRLLQLLLYLHQTSETAAMNSEGASAVKAPLLITKTVVIRGEKNMALLYHYKAHRKLAEIFDSLLRAENRQTGIEGERQSAGEG